MHSYLKPFTITLRGRILPATPGRWPGAKTIAAESKHGSVISHPPADPGAELVSCLAADEGEVRHLSHRMQARHAIQRCAGCKVFGTQKWHEIVDEPLQPGVTFTCQFDVFSRTIRIKKDLGGKYRSSRRYLRPACHRRTVWRKRHTDPPGAWGTGRCFPRVSPGISCGWGILRSYRSPFRGSAQRGAEPLLSARPGAARARAEEGGEGDHLACTRPERSAEGWGDAARRAKRPLPAPGAKPPFAPTYQPGNLQSPLSRRFADMPFEA
jgi:hypothetical protein